MIFVNICIYLNINPSKTMSKCEQCIVRQMNSLQHLSKEELLRMSNCKTSQIVKKGELLFDEGDYVNGIFCIKQGTCKISKISENGRSQIIGLVQKGNLLGERSMLSEEASNLKAIALDDMQVCFIPKEEIIKDLQKNPNFSMDVLKTMADKLKKADNLIVDMAHKTVKQRLAELILHLDSNFNPMNKSYIDINLSRKDFADIIGAATESTIRLLTEFKRKEIIAYKGKYIRIINSRELEKIAKGF